MAAYFGNAFAFSAAIFVLSFVAIGVIWYLDKLRVRITRR